MRAMPDTWEMPPLSLAGPFWWMADRQERFLEYVRRRPGCRSHKVWKAAGDLFENDYEGALLVLGHIRAEAPRRARDPFRRVARSRLWPVAPPEAPYPELAKELQEVLEATLRVQEHPEGERLLDASHYAIKAILVEARRREGHAGAPEFDYRAEVDEFLDALDEGGAPRPAPSPLVALLRRIKPMPDLECIRGVGQATAAKLQAGGIVDVYDVADLDLRRGVDVPGVGRDALRGYRDEVRKMLADEGFPWPRGRYTRRARRRDGGVSGARETGMPRRAWTWRRLLCRADPKPEST